MKWEKVITTALIIGFLVGCSYTYTMPANTEKVVLLHGYARSAFAVRDLKNAFIEAGFDVTVVDYDTIGEDITAVKQEAFAQIDGCCINKKYQKVHFVGHSMGGLIVRSYLSENELNNLGNVVLIGTPNKGTPLVNYLKTKWYFPYLGNAILSMDSQGSELISSLGKPYYNLGIIAGVSESDNEDIIKGEDDGIVPLSSTKVVGMSDFLVVNLSHTDMRDNDLVMEQTVHFLQQGEFTR